MNKLKTAIIGLSFIAAGAIIILSNLGIIDIVLKRILISWQMLLIVFGLLAFLSKNFRAGAIFFIVGVFYILPLIPEFDLGKTFTRNFWPLLLVLVGVAILFTRRKYDVSKFQNRSETFSKDGYINQNFIFNGSDQIFVGSEFKGGRISTIFGGTNLDLSKAQLPAEGDAELNVEGFCGGATIIVPANWRVEIRNNSFLGGGSDQRPKEFGDKSTNKLILNINYVFGGAEVK